MGVITAVKWPLPHFNVPDNQAARRGHGVGPRGGCQTPNYDEMIKGQADGCQGRTAHHLCRWSVVEGDYWRRSLKKQSWGEKK